MIQKPTLGQIAAGAYRTHPRYRGCVGHWLMGEGGGLTAYDISGYENHGTLTTGAGWSYGPFGPVTAFDGVAAFIAVLDSSSLLVTTRMSMSFWTKNNVTPAQYDGVFGKVASDNWDVGYGCYYNSATTLRFFVRDYLANGVTLTIVPTQWNHLVAIYDGATVQFYLNGLAGTADTYTGDILDSIAPLHLGKLGSASTYNINGLLDDMRLYNRALTELEVRSLYTDPFLEFRTPKIRQSYYLVTAPTGPPAGSLALLGVGR